jgi:hypothetical protein
MVLFVNIKNEFLLAWGEDYEEKLDSLHCNISACTKGIKNSICPLKKKVFKVITDQRMNLSTTNLKPV